MNLQELLAQLEATKAEAQKKSTLTSAQRIELSKLIYELELRVIGQPFEALQALNTLADPAADLAQLRQLTATLKQETDDMARRNALIGQIVGLAKLGLRAAGVPLPA